MFSKFHQRSLELEHIDIGDYSEEEYEGCITELQLVNDWMGDARALKASLLKEIEERGLRRCWTTPSSCCRVVPENGA